MVEKIKNSNIAILLLLIGAVYFFLEYLSPLIAPILCAMLFVTIFGSTLQKMQSRLKLHRQIGAALLLVIAGSVVLVLLGVLFSWIMGSLPQWVDVIGEAGNYLVNGVHTVCEKLSDVLGTNSAYMEETIMTHVEKGMSNFRESTLPGMLSQSLEYAKILASIGGFLLTFLIATILLAKDYDAIMNRMLEQERCHVLLEVICGVIRYIAGFVKAEATIMSIVGVVAATTLTIAGVHHGVLWGILAGVLDAFPFVGTGIVLCPLAVVQLLQGSYGKAICCLLLYVACIIIREFLEPRLIGRKLGVSPIAILVSLYAGIQLFGVWGIIKGPLGFIIIYETYNSLKGRGYGQEYRQENAGK